MELNLLDGLLGLLLVYVVWRGFRQGALSQIAAFGGGALGLVLGAALAPRLARIVTDGPGVGLALLTLGLLLLAVLLGQTGGMALGLRLRRAAVRLGIGPLDRAVGVAVGALGLVLVVWLLGGVLSQGPWTALAQQVRQSRVVAVVADALPPAPDVFGRVAAYLDGQGFPQVFAGPGGLDLAPPVGPADPEAARLAATAGGAGTLRVRAQGCEAISAGSAFAVAGGFAVTNAHVVAGAEQVRVYDGAGEHEATVVHFDPDLDLAVLQASTLEAPALAWVDEPADRGTQGATLGFPGGVERLVAKATTVQGRGQAVGRDIYGRGVVTREVLELTAGDATGVQRGDSGGPFVTADGRVAGVVFAANAAEAGSGYALTADEVRDDVAAALADPAPAGTGPCRF